MVNKPLQLKKVKALHGYDLEMGWGEVWLPNALERKYPKAASSLSWAFLFPATNPAADPTTGVFRRHHQHKTILQKSIREAIIKSGILIKSIMEMLGSDPHKMRAFTDAMHDKALKATWMIAREIPIGDAKTMLDIGGGPGTYSLEWCKQCVRN